MNANKSDLIGEFQFSIARWLLGKTGANIVVIKLLVYHTPAICLQQSAECLHKPAVCILYTV